MEPLEPFDELFLALESGATVGHSGGLVLFDAAGASTALTPEHLRELIDRHLEGLPVLRKRPVSDPSRPGHHRWAQDETVDLTVHVQGHRLPDGGDRALGRLVGQLNAPALDRSRPLWEWHVIDGLQDGRVATYLKFHHALGDAVPGRQVIETVFAIEGEAEPVFVGGGEGDLAPEDAAAAAAKPPPKVRAMRFNRPLSAERDFAWGSSPRARIEQIREASGTTFTSVLFAAWAGALRGWLALRGETPVEPLVARIPISLRQRDDAPEGGNRLAVVAVSAPVNESSADVRLRYAHQEIARAKQIGLSGDWRKVAPSGGFNFALSTFVGSTRPIGWAGAKCLGAFPLAMVNSSGLSIASVTTPTDLRIGVHVDAEQIADPLALLRAFDLALAELEAVTAN